MLTFSGVQPIVGEPFATRDGIRNELNLLGFFHLSTAVLAPSIDGIARLTGHGTSPGQEVLQWRIG